MFNKLVLMVSSNEKAKALLKIAFWSFAIISIIITIIHMENAEISFIYNKF